MSVVSRTALILLFLLSVSSEAAMAHRVNLHALQQGRIVKVHAYWADGTDARDAVIKAIDSNGKTVSQGITDSDGICMFSLPRAGVYSLVFDAGMGHRAESSLEYKLPEDLKSSASGNSWGQAFAHPGPLQPCHEYIKSKAGSPASQCAIPDAMLRQIDAMLDRKLRPVLDELLVLRERDNRIRIRDITGGLGYILGIAGLALWFSARKERGKRR